MFWNSMRWPQRCRRSAGRSQERRRAYHLALAAVSAFVDEVARAAIPTADELLPPRRGRRPRRLAVEEEWLTALAAPHGRFDADPDELDVLADALTPWDEIGIEEPGPARAIFRLADVDGETPSWRLEFLLQSVADPSLLVSAEQAWDDDGSLRRWLNRPEELLLAELGRAVRIYPELTSGLRTARPSRDRPGRRRCLPLPVRRGTPAR